MSDHQPFHLSVPVSAVDHWTGSAHAAVTVVEYGDLECPNCKTAAPAFKLLVKHFAGRARLVYRHFPLEAVHTHALLAAEAAECAGGQGKFWEMHDVLFENQAHLQQKHLRGYAEHLRLDMTRYTADMSDHVYLQRIREHIASGTQSGVRSTPAVFINGAILDVSFGVQTLFDATEAALKRRKG
ncbi:MAG: DsbA family protein [Casimicrobiaceae bacterium]